MSKIMPFTPAEFHDLVDSDVWVLEQMLTLPSDPEPTITRTPTDVRIELFDTVGMPQMQAAVEDYRRTLLPAIFVMAQKVYAELFRIVLAGAGRSAGNRQHDVETALRPLAAAGNLSTFHPFTDAAQFAAWWDSQYNFEQLRYARNQVVHGGYSFSGGRLLVNDAGIVRLDWSEHDTLEFARAVVSLARRI